MLRKKFEGVNEYCQYLQDTFEQNLFSEEESSTTSTIHKIHFKMKKYVFFVVKEILFKTIELQKNRK